MSSLQQIIFRGDQACYVKIGDKFPYIDRAKAAGATGILIWFWAQPLRSIAKEFCDYCKARDISVHLGIGIGAYDVCDGQNPLEPDTRSSIQRHLDRTLEEFDLAGVEYQTGEYDLIEYKGQTVSQKTHAEKICESLNPYIDYILKAQPDLWVRTELNSKICPRDQWADVARLLDPRCTVEWSWFIGPFAGDDCYKLGMELLSISERFSWFLKVQFRRDHHTREVMKEETPVYQRAWIEHWRGWVRLLDQMNRKTLTICNVDDEYPLQDKPILSAAVALAKNPDVPTDELMHRFFSATPK